MGLRQLRWSVVLFASAACATHPSTPAAPTPAVAVAAGPADPPLPALRTGSETLRDAGTLAARVIAHQVGADLEILRIDLATADCPPGLSDEDGEITVALGAGTARGHGVLRREHTPQHDDILVARPADQLGKPLAGDALFARSQCHTSGVHYHFETPTTGAAVDPQLRAAWATELAAQLEVGGWRPSDAWHAFAHARLLQLAGRDALDPTRPTAPATDSLARMMETTTGLDALQEALQSDRGLFAALRHDQPTIAIETVHGPALASHPWAAMQKALAHAVPAEPLAAETPAEFYYLRFGSLAALFRVLDQADAWATPILTLMNGRSEQRGLAERYQTQLGLERSELARAFGGQVVQDLAVVGSDPYLGEGADVTLLFRVKSKPLFDGTLASGLARHGAAHGGIAASTIAYAGTTIEVARSADGAVHRYRAQLGALELVSNSLVAIERVIDTHGAHHPNLGAEPDFQYALARGADTQADVLGFIGDRFVAEVVGPRQKILEARRQIALAELSAPPFAGLLYGWIYGRSPASLDELVASGLLHKDEVAHHDGTPISWTPGAAPRSSWGQPSALTPLLDLPPVVTVTEVERDAYARFASTYESYWKSYIDPIAVRVAIAPDSLAVDLRVLPLIDASDYRKLWELVGDARVTAAPLGTGARVTVGLGEHAIAEARSGLGMLVRELPDLKWLGDWVAIGADDRSQVAAAMLTELDVPQAPDAAMSRHAHDKDARRHVPVYGAVGVRDRAAAALFIVGVRKFAEEAVPNVLAWGEAARVGDVAIVRVAAKDDTFDGMELYYAFVGHALVVSLDEQTIRHQIEEIVAGRGPGVAPEGAAGAAQLILDEHAAANGPLWHIAAWLLEEPAREAGDRARGTAEALLYGAPEVAGQPERVRALAMAIFGAVPLTADGRAFERGVDGVRDPVRGSRFAPVWPELPVAGSPIAGLLGAITRARCEIGFEVEPGTATKDERSLHLRLTLGTH